MAAGSSLKSKLATRMDELKQLRPGWLDGRGVVPPPAALDGLAVAFETHYPDDLRLPYLFLTPDDGLLAEWSLGPWSLSLEIDPATRHGDYHALNVETDEEFARRLDTTDADDWDWLAGQVRSLGGVAG